MQIVLRAAHGIWHDICHVNVKRRCPLPLPARHSHGARQAWRLGELQFNSSEPEVAEHLAELVRDQSVAAAGGLRNGTATAGQALTSRLPTTPTHQGMKDFRKGNDRG